MELRDLIATPIVLLVVYSLAYALRPFICDEVTRGYFLPALTLKVIGAVALGFIYQFYYNGGDTYAYHTHGSREIWNAFMDSPSLGIRLIFADGKYQPGFYDFMESIWYFRDQNSYFIIRIATIFDFITFSSYSGTAVLFSVLGFCGGWMLFLTFYKMHRELHGWIALSTLFIPSVIFWGSGILKDTVTLSFLGVGTYAFYALFVERHFSVSNIFLLLLSLFVIFSIKKYILVTFVGAATVWVFFSYFSKLQSLMIRITVIPFLLVGCSVIAYFAINKVVADDPKYALDKIAQTSKITAYDIRFLTGRDAGSGYTLGELDGTFTGMLALAPAAVNVSLFRPYIWEIKNPLMLISAFESLCLLLLTVYVLAKVRSRIFRYLQIPEIAFCFVFAIIFAFGVGVSTYNFGTLARYKIPMLPFYMLALGFVLDYWNKDKKLVALEDTE